NLIDACCVLSCLNGQERSTTARKRPATNGRRGPRPNARKQTLCQVGVDWAPDSARTAFPRPGRDRGADEGPGAAGSRGRRIGPAGLALDRSGRPAFAYALRLANAKTWLRVLTLDAGGRWHTHGITKGGFPASAQVPGSAPVLFRGQLHVVETFTSAAIDWGPK